MQGVLTADASSATYLVAIERDQAARVLIDQGDRDLALVLRSPGDATGFTVDRQERGPESATLLATASESFAIEVRPAAREGGRQPFSIRLQAAPAAATAADRLAVRAERLESEGKQLSQDNRPAEAQSRVEQALALWRQAGRSDDVAGAIGRIGEFQQRQGQLESAIASFTQASTLARAPSFLHAALLNNLGVVLGIRGELADAHGAFQKAQSEWQALALPMAAAATAVSEGSLAFQSGEYQVALEHFLDGLEVFEQHDDPRAGLVLNNVAVTYRALGDRQAASSYFARALDRFRSTDAMRTRTLVRLGQLALDDGDIATAERHAFAALPVTRAVKDAITEADTLDLLGQIAEAGGQSTTAQEHFGAALAIYRSRGVRRSLADTLQHLGSLHSARGDQRAARTALREALALRREVGLPDAEAETRYELGLTEVRDGELAEADRQLAAALTLIEGIRGRVAGDYSRSTFYASRKKYFTARIDVLMRLHDRSPAGNRYAREAFNVSERERARSLDDAIRESGAPAAGTPDAALIARRRELRAQLDFWSLQLAARANADAAARRRVAEKVDALLLEVRELDGRIRASNSPSGVGSSPALTIDALQSTLLRGDESVVLRYVLGVERSYVWVAGDGLFRAFPLPAGAEIDRQARLVVEAVSTVRTPATSAELLRRYERESAALSAMVLKPVASFIRGRRLLIVADGALQFVPFAALPDPEGAEPLIVARGVVMLPSVSTLAAVRGAPAERPATAGLAVLADPVYELDDPRLAGVPKPTRRGADTLRVGRLPLSAYEAEAILALVPKAERLEALGFAATRESALDLLRTARVVHFAAHGLPDAARPELASVALSMYDRQGRAVDGLLRVQDLYDNRATLRADVVVLSACDTTIGKDDPGEGLMSLARGFLASGARTVVGSLYPVQEEQTLELMKAFYGELFGPQHLAPAAALRSAQLALRRQPRFRDPYYWSAFVVTGSYGG